MPVESSAPVCVDFLLHRSRALATGEDFRITFTLYTAPKLPPPNPAPAPVNLTRTTPVAIATALGVNPITYTIPVAITTPPGTDGKITLAIPAADVANPEVIPDECEYEIWIEGSGDNRILQSGRMVCNG